MKGFAASALILLSDIDKYNETYGGYKQQYKQALDNLFAYLNTAEMRPLALVTDPLALELLAGRNDILWLCTENNANMYFMQRYCGLNLPKNNEPLPLDITKELDHKYPINRGISQQARGYAVSKRVSLAERKLMERETVVFVFGSLFKPKSKENDGRAVIYIDNAFIPKLKLSGCDSPINPFLGFDRANLALFDWRLCDEH